MRNRSARKLNGQVIGYLAFAVLSGVVFVSCIRDGSHNLAVGSGVLTIFFSALAWSSYGKQPVDDANTVHVDLGTLGPEGAEMLAVLEGLGIPLDTEATGPREAMVGGYAKATIFRAHQQILSGRLDDGVHSLEAVLGTLERENDPAWNRLGAAAHYLIAKVHQAKGDRDQALAEFTESLKLSPDYLLAQAGLTGPSRTTEH
jgi:tetratricopeptide (TPR) repeat protein